jgi:ABC-type branched-subunit amino acid transport system ATPase component/ABC-type branched-subunit amino acid transport system permease subunit
VSLIASVKIAGFDLGLGYLLKGFLTGMTYALLSVGLVLVYRSSKFINFAHIGVGLFGASILAKLALPESSGGYDLPFWVAMVTAMIVGAFVSVGTEVVVVRPLRRSPRVLSMVATLGMGAFFFFAALAVNGKGLQPLVFPKPNAFPTFKVDPLFVDTYDSAQLILSPILLILLGLFLTRTRFGIGIRGAASNRDAAAGAGASPSTMAILSWGLAGALAAYSVALLIPSKGAVNPASIGPDLLLRALAAAALVGFRSIGGAVVAALGIGVTEAILASNSDANGWIEILILLALLVALLITKVSGRDAAEPWEGLSIGERLPTAYRGIWSIRNLGAIVGSTGFVILGVVPFLVSNSTAVALNQVLALAVVGMSVGIITGLGGQLTLGQFAIGGIGAAVAVIVTQNSGSFALGLVAAMASSGLVSLAIGFPALRVRGLFLGVATLAFALFCTGWLFAQNWMFGSYRPTLAPDLGLVEGKDRNYYWIALAALMVSVLLTRNLRRGAFGRKLVAVRDNTDAARALSIPATRVKLQAYLIGGMLAGLGAAIFVQSSASVSAETINVQLSIDAVIVTVVGGIGSLAGPVIGALYIFGIPALFEIENNEALAALSAAWLILLIYQPNGIAGLYSVVIRRVEDLIARFRGIDPKVARATVTGDESESLEASSRLFHHEPVDEGPGVGLDASAAVEPVAGRGEREAEVRPLLSVRDITRRFGGLIAVNSVSFDVYPGETLGLIGPNGAGKTTLFELVCGFTKPDSGSVWFDGRAVTRMAPEERSRIGMVRSFQSATLFPTLSLLDTVMVAQERSHRSGVFESVLGLSQREAVREREARDVIELFGLTRFVDAPIGVLPTGTRRLVELACTVALRPKLILLDEPSAGIAQAETEELGEVLLGIRDNYGVTFVVIEHDMPLLTDICDRMIALEVGQVIASGTPHEVQNDPAVVESYLGSNAVAVARSGSAVD